MIELLRAGIDTAEVRISITKLILTYDCYLRIVGELPFNGVSL